MASRRPGWSDRADPPGRPPRRGGHHQPRRQRRADPRVPRPTVRHHGVRRRAGLHELPGRRTPRARAACRPHDPDEWVWLLHDDANPAPDALAELLAAAAEHPDAAILGPKLREWPSLRRLLEVGLTITGTGHRETGLERGEYDQGQHDEVREVLAVNTAGMLVRRRVLEELGGLDEELPIFGNDIDFGWRAALAGHRTLVVPQAVVFHAEAAHRGLRRTPLTGRHTHYQERRAALFTSLANVSSRALPWQFVRLFFGSLLRVLGFLGVRSVGEALDELAAVLSVHGRPGQVVAARRSRAQLRRGDAARVRHLLAPAWLPYRHGLDAVTDLAAAATNQAADVAERRRIARAGAPAPGTREERRTSADDEDDAFLTDSGLVARFFTNPVALVLVASCLLAFVAGREAFGSITGGALAPVPAAAADWWRLHVESWHPLGTGTDVPAPAYVLPFALVASLLLGNTGAVLSGLMLLAFPIAAWGAWRLLKVVGRLVDPLGLPRWLLVWGALTYALVPVTSGAWGEGRFGTVAVAALLPWAAHAALGFVDPDRDRRWRAAWRTALLLALGTAFVPGFWLFAVLVATVVLGTAAFISPASPARARQLGPAGRGPRRHPAAGGAVVRPAAHDGLRRGPAARVRSPHRRPGDVRRAADRSAQRARRPGVAGHRPRPARVRRPRPGAHPRAGAGLLAGRPRGGGRVRHPLPRHARPAGRDDAAEPGPVRRDPPGHRGRRGGARCRRLPPPSRRPPPGVAARSRGRPGGRRRGGPARRHAVVALGAADRDGGDTRRIPRSPPTWSRARCSVPSTVCW